MKNKLRKYISGLISRHFQREILQEIVAERVRIHNEIFKASSVKIIPGCGPKGSDSKVISIGTPKLEEILMPPLPKWYRPAHISDIAAPIHPSLKNIDDAERFVAIQSRLNVMTKKLI